jgi:hypothetical protein
MMELEEWKGRFVKTPGAMVFICDEMNHDKGMSLARELWRADTYVEVYCLKGVHPQLCFPFFTGPDKRLK